MSSALYLYGFVGKPLPGAGSPTGVDERPVRVLDFGSVHAVVSDVDAGRYDEANLEARLKDLDWVARQGASHETVVTWLSDHNTIVPARFLTIFSSEQALASAVEDRREVIEGQLRRFDGLREWDLKVHYDFDVLAPRLGELSEEIARADTRLRAAAPGRRYLLERKRDELARAEAANVARRRAEQLLAVLRSHAEDIRDMQLPPRREGMPVVLSAAMLVPDDRADALQEQAAELVPDLEARGIHVKLTGPWAPYRFVGCGDCDA